MDAVGSREDGLPEPDYVEHLELLGVEKSHPSETVVEGVYFEVIQPLPDGRGYNEQHLIHCLQFPSDPCLRLIQVLDVQLYDGAHCVIQHQEAATLFLFLYGLMPVN